MSRPNHLRAADDRLRNMAQSIGLESLDPDAFESAVQACDYVRLASRVDDESREHWLRKAHRAASAAAHTSEEWQPFAQEVSLLLSAQLGLQVA